MYPWPISDFDNAMDVALDTAMNYLERTGQAEEFVAVQRVAAMAIVAAWKMGERHRLRLANIAIKSVERKTEPFSEDQKRG
jgi:ribosomal protein L20A (L18A)